MAYESLKGKLPHIYEYMQLFNYNATWSSDKRYIFLDKLISELAPGKKVVETGIYSGCLSYSAYYHGAKKVVGFDIRKGLVRRGNQCLSKMNVPQKECSFVVADATEFDYSDFDLVLCLGVLYNVSDDRKHKILERISKNKMSLLEFWCLCDDMTYPTTTTLWRKNIPQYMPNKLHAEKMMKEHCLHFEEVTPLRGGFLTPPGTNRYYLCKPQILM